MIDRIRFYILKYCWITEAGSFVSAAYDPEPRLKVAICRKA